MVERAMIKAALVYMEQAESAGYYFTENDRRLLLILSFYQKDLMQVERAVYDVAVERKRGGPSQKLLTHDTVSEKNETLSLLVDYIIQLETMSYHQNKANEVLERLLKSEHISYDLNKALEEKKKETGRQEPERVM